MYRPIQILDSLIYLYTILSPFCGSESVMLYFQSSQYPHPKLRKRIPLDSWHFQIGDHLVKVIIKERMHFNERFCCLWFYLDLFQFCQCFPGFFLVPAIAKHMPHSQKETPHPIHFLIFFQDSYQVFLLLQCHVFVRFEQQVSFLPQSLCERFQFPLIPWCRYFLRESLFRPVPVSEIA